MKFIVGLNAAFMVIGIIEATRTGSLHPLVIAAINAFVVFYELAE